MTNQVNHQQEDGRLDDGRMRLAVIDDEDRWLGVFKRMFRDTSYQLETFSDPRNFLSVIGNEPKRFAGIICDIKMPEIDGHQVFKEIKENPETANIPFVMVSGMLTENLNLNRVQGIAHVSKLDDNLRTRIFDELIEIIENWPFLETFLQEKQVDPEDIKFFHQFYVNYHLFFGQILDFVRRMEIACVNSDDKEAIRVPLQPRTTPFVAHLEGSPPL